MTCFIRFRNIMSINAVLVVLASIIHNVPAYPSGNIEDARIYKYNENSLQHNDVGDDGPPLPPPTSVATSRQESQQNPPTNIKVERNDGSGLYQPSYTRYPSVKRPSFSRPAPTALFTPSSPSASGNTATGPATFSNHSPNFNLPASPDQINSLNSFGFSSAENGATGFSYSGGKSNFDLHASNPFGPPSASAHINSNEGIGNNYLGSGGGNLVGDFSSNGGDGDQGGYSYPKPLQPIISKSVYVHIAPPEEEVPRQKIIIPKVPPKKNYQIVFIKAPTPPPPTMPIIPAFPPNSDKTLIYVLHPKLEEAPPIRIPPPPENLPVKPEVYFIRYKSRKEISDESAEEGYNRRYGRGGEEPDEVKPTKPSKKESKTSSSNRSEVPLIQYQDDQTDSSGESSNIIQVYAKERERGRNAH